MARGGKRPGAGRKKGSKNKKTIAQEQALLVLREEILKEWGDLIKAKMNLAKGVYYEKKVVDKETGETKTEIYRKLPDGASLEWLFSIVVGKPKESLDVNYPNLPYQIIIQKGEPGSTTAKEN